MKTLNHDDYAEEAEAAQRGGAWPQAAALWRRARDVAHATEANIKPNILRKYEQAAIRCDAHSSTNHLFEQIVREELEITTLAARNIDDEDIHSLAVWEIHNILARAYQAGFQAGREHNQ